MTRARRQGAKGLRLQAPRNIKFAMTTNELCELAGLSRSTVQQWLECGFLEAENVGIQGGGVRRILAPGQLERARL
jgi:excisionase family DNA binding protein